jgi:hypothetical protein
MYTRSKSWRAIGALAVAVMAAAATPSVASAFCDQEVVRNYERPLEKMPPLRGVPANHVLPFGPSGLYLFKGSQTPVMVPIGTPGGVGFAITTKRGEPNVKPIAHLDWLGTLKMTEVDKSGSPIRLLEWRRKRITRAPGGGLTVDFSGRVGFYRLDFVVRNRKGRVLGKFGEYFRVMPATTEGRLELSSSSYQPGETVSACLENLGTTILVYGAPPLIEVFDGTTWTRSPIDPPMATLFTASLLSPGRSHPLGTFALPIDAPPGHYRWRWTGSAMNGEPSASFELAAEFTINAAP